MPTLHARAASASAAKLARLERRERRVWGSADGYVTLTTAHAEELADRFGPRRAVAVVPDGTRLIAERAFAWTGPRAARPVVAYAGHLYPWKGVDVLIEALALLPDVDGRIVGGHPRERDLERVTALAAARGLGRARPVHRAAAAAGRRRRDRGRRHPGAAEHRDRGVGALHVAAQAVRVSRRRASDRRVASAGAGRGARGRRQRAARGAGGSGGAGRRDPPADRRSGARRCVSPRGRSPTPSSIPGRAAPSGSTSCSPAPCRRPRPHDLARAARPRPLPRLPRSPGSRRGAGRRAGRVSWPSPGHAAGTLREFPVVQKLRCAVSAGVAATTWICGRGRRSPSRRSISTRRCTRTRGTSRCRRRCCSRACASASCAAFCSSRPAIA